MNIGNQSRPECFFLLVAVLLATIIATSYRTGMVISPRIIRPTAVANGLNTAVANGLNTAVANVLKKKMSPLEIAWSILGAFKSMAPPFDDIDNIRSYFHNNKATEWKVILRVGDFNFDHLRWKDGSAHLQKISCPVTNCHFTSNISDFPIADAVIISEFRKKEFERFSPKPRHQVWVAQHLEPPYHNRINPKLLNGLVNWTASYRRDSTFVLPYGTWQELETPTKDNLSRQNHAAGRSKKVAMFVSNCRDINGRLQYAIELNKTIPVHIFGRCGSMKCPRQSSACSDMLKKDYKFYLAFENSNCHDYITEKLHVNALSNDIVPIVMGARPEDYAAAAPPRSYIHVDDFQSPRHLGDYLNLVDSNDTLYNEFFRYKLRYRHRPIRISELTDAYWCQLCTLLHVNDFTNLAIHWYADYEKWWNGVCDYEFGAKNQWPTWRDS